MPLRKPCYRFHKARSCAVVTINGKDHYLGIYDSPESWEKYHRLIAEWYSTRNLPPVSLKATPPPLSIAELVLAYWNFAKTYYVKDGQPTSEQDTIRQALRFVRGLYGSTPAHEFSPKKLKAVRQAMAEHTITRKFKVFNPDTGEVQWREKVLHHGLSRRFINKQVSRIKRMFAWAVEEEQVPVEVHAALLRAKGLKKGKSIAREKPWIKPISATRVEEVLPHVPPAVKAMILVQRLCGGRPQDVVEMRVADIDTGGLVWEYRPRRYKTQHHNAEDYVDRERVVYLGPCAQAILKPFLTGTPEDYLFSPIRSEKARNALRQELRQSPVTPSQACRRPKRRERAPLREHYDVASYRRAIRRACLKIGIPIWHPNQLRHSRLTEIRKRFGLEASRVCGGHREVGVTQHYAEQDKSLAHEVMAEIGLQRRSQCRSPRRRFGGRAGRWRPRASRNPVREAYGISHRCHRARRRQGKACEGPGGTR
jgi:integrase